MAKRAHPSLARDKRREANRRRLCDSILQFLREHGPTDFAVLVAELQTTAGLLSRAGRTLQDIGAIHRYRANPGRDSRRIWSLEPPAPRAKKSSGSRKPGIGIDAEHMQWMETYRKKAELRRQRISLETPNWSAA